MEILAIDLGNKQVKLKSSKAEYRFPSRLLLERKSILDKATQALHTLDDVDEFSMLNSKESYLIGLKIDKLNKSSDMRETISFGRKRYNNPNFEKLIEYSLAKLSSDFEDNQSFEVVVGVPTEDYTETIIKDIIKLFNPSNKTTQQHTAVLNNQTINTLVKKTHVLPQPMGTMYDLILDNDRNIKNKKIMEQNLAIVDIGGGTILFDSINHFNFDTINRKQEQSGVHKLLGLISSEYEGDIQPNVFEIENIIRSYSDSGKYIYNPTEHIQEDLTDLIQSLIDSYTEEIVQKVLSVYKDIDRFDNIVFTGGGSTIINQAIVKSYLDHVIFSDNKEYSNVYGFYKYGLLISE
ncbi:ParM/StbA family protein [Listeria welshimeri]|uniref:ParM/StbA family protein n=1 Tax=Listeria welshimeri TaxID=1643 RepID=UPI0016255A3B|nr:ParM/StbA family protein [Listeria welshimeri]MBC1342343.1 ParM/StbA family protein [Listeria welshimeri]MBC1350704.1 ParM/StbA family protein [Listeria welshimeri]MBC1705847.1 ParM/StbA family protein [Listeria welshimeri]MBF2342536.1 ParM/StbA family protein [Listeria welshimeri]